MEVNDAIVQEVLYKVTVAQEVLYMNYLSVRPLVLSNTLSHCHIVIPYTQGLCESIKRICGRYSIQTHFKGGKTIKNLLVSPKDKDPMLNQSGAIYRYQCNNLGCDDEYIGETSRTFGERYKEHLKAPSAIHHHSTLTGHTTNHNNFQIIGREGGAQFS